ncbi:sporulation protein [Streptomyces sp. G-G2]|uniref:sporulation protein n=1 Tax=Streptomyces sp. G-G2 TaxID=3046201 RepID=UPI0024B9D330|nr:sporulation protein [Streptomyces sp. G-G2]MDJ0386284.1 sporulation protein [Streptomyces sp. G-G2]
MPTTRAQGPNSALAQLIEASGASRARLAHRVNQLAAARGVTVAYTHTSVANWTVRGMIPRTPGPACLAVALGECLGRPVTVAEIGMNRVSAPDPALGLDFPRDPGLALRAAAEHWSTVDRRTFLHSSSSFAIGAYATPTTRWLAVPADTGPAPRISHPGARRVGRADLAELWEASEEARRWDSKFGGGNWKAGAVSDCLRHKAAPLLRGTYTEQVGRELFTAISELARVAAWSAFDMGHHQAAQRDFIQSLRLARAAGNVEAGAYTLATMSLQATLRGYHQDAIDMAQGAYDRARHIAAPRVLAFIKLAEARAHAKAADTRAASAALAVCEALLGSVRPGSRDPEWIAYLTHGRISADATEIHRDLGKPAAALRWDAQAAVMPSGVFTRAVGIRAAVVASTHLRARELDLGLTMGERAVTILRQVRSTRAHDYLRSLNHELTPWAAEPQVNDFLHRSRQVLSAA